MTMISLVNGGLLSVMAEAEDLLEEVEAILIGVSDRSFVDVEQTGDGSSLSVRAEHIVWIK